MTRKLDQFELTALTSRLVGRIEHPTHLGAIPARRKYLKRAANDAAESTGALRDNVKACDDLAPRLDAQRARLREQGGPVDASLALTLQDRAVRGDAFTAQDLPQIRAALAAAEQNLAASQQNSTAVPLQGLSEMEGRVTMLRNLLERTQGEVAQSEQRKKTTQPSAPSSAPQPAQVVNINRGRRVSQVYVADSASAANLEAVLRQLAGAAGAAS